MPELDFDPKTEIPDLSGKVILITGGTAGLGASAARTLAAHSPAHVFLSGRNKTAADKLIASLSDTYPNTAFSFLSCDLTSLASVQAAAKECLASAPQLSDGAVPHPDAEDSRRPRLDVLLCNAGIMAVPPGLTKDGYEIQFGTNHVGHALLIKLLLPTLRATAAATAQPARCVILSSQAYFTHPMAGIMFDSLKTTQKYGLGDGLAQAPGLRYAQSKLANLLYAAELARRETGEETSTTKKNEPRSGVKEAEKTEVKNSDDAKENDETKNKQNKQAKGEVVFVSIHPGVIFTDLVEKLSFSKRALVKVTTVGRVLSEEQGGWNSAWACSAEVDRDGEKSKGKTIKSGEMYFPVGKLHKPMRMGGDKELARELWEWTEKELEPWAS